MRQEKKLSAAFIFAKTVKECVKSKKLLAHFLFAQKEVIGVPRKYRRLLYQDRKDIERLCKRGKKVAEIADELGVHKATIYHELTRGGASKGNYSLYNAEKAQKNLG